MLCTLVVGLGTQGHAQAAPAAQDRPAIHYSPERNWMNDPNGLVYFDGEYHLFYQYNPKASVPANISWGHAVSRDLLHWQELPVAIPATETELVFTGSVVVDERNTSGLCADGKPCMVAVYTAHHPRGDSALETQDLAVSQDRGRTWQRYAGNPVLDLHMANFRDPGVSWNSAAGSWLMSVALPDEHQVAFYSSPDLKQWQRLSTFGPAAATGGQWECPSLVHLPATTGATDMWALKVGLNPGGLQGGSGEQYFLGEFDGRTFTPSSKPGAHGWTDYGKDSYCAIPYNHLPAGSAPTLIGWMDNWQYARELPTSPWRGQMTLPRTLHVVHDADGIALAQEPDTASLRMGAGRAVRLAVRGGKTSGTVATGSPAELLLDLKGSDADRFGVRLFSDAAHWTEVGIDRQRHVLYVDRTHASIGVPGSFAARTEAPLSTARPLNLRIVLDRISVEVFAQNGTLAMTNLVFPPAPDVTAVPFAEGGSGSMTAAGHTWQLRGTRGAGAAQAASATPGERR